MIDLHLHTTASDGQSTPAVLVTAASGAGCTTIAVTDHDTVAGVAPARAAAARAGIGFVAGIEMTAVDRARDIHILGYFVDPADSDLEAFLTAQRALRRDRVAAIVARLAVLGAPIDHDAIAQAAAVSGRAIGRPAVAAALVAAGHVPSMQAAFDRYLAEGRPAHVPREGLAPPAIVERIRRAGGIASLAHPGKYGRDDLIAPLVDAGLAAIEVFHPDHTADDTARYTTIAASRGLIMTGGSDFHGAGTKRARGLGRFGTPPGQFEALAALAASRRA